MRYWLLILGFVLSGCAVNDFSGYSTLPEEKRKYFIPFSIDSINSKLTYTEADFRVQELRVQDIKQLAKTSRYTWIVLWAPWCPGEATKEFARDYINYEKALAGKDVRLVFVAVAYGPDAIRRVLHELNYQNYSYVIPNVPNQDGTRIFRAGLNNKFKYRNANHYIFEKDKGLIYTGNDEVLPFQKLQTIINLEF